MPYGQPPADFEIDEVLVRHLLETQFPDLARLPLSHAESGWDNAMFQLGDHLAVRLPRRKDALPCTQAEIEFLAELVQDLPLPIPAPLHVGSPSPRFPHPWSVVPWLSGNPADLCRPLPEEAAVLAHFFNALHKPAPDNAPENTYRGVPLAEIQERRTSAGNPIEPHLSPHLQEMWNLAFENLYEGPPVWLHGDLHPLNVLTQNGRISAVLDWGDLTSGDPAGDLAYFYMLFDDPDAILQATQDQGTVCRARGWALHLGVTHILHGDHGHVRHGEIGRRTLRTLENASLRS